MDKAMRRRRDRTIINRRIRFLKLLHSDIEISEPNRFNKKHPFDCGITDCPLCSHETKKRVKKVKTKEIIEQLKKENIK
ncbi:MAG: hypothetical protein WC783_00605 [Candidatus Paceibacterota bacterium]|jgi:hypothetical protein